MFEAFAISRAHDDFGVEVEGPLAATFGTYEGAGFEGHEGADAAQGGAALAALGDGGLVDAGERRELVGVGGAAAVFVVVPEATAHEVAVDAALDGGGELLELVVRRGRQGVEGERTVGTFGPDAVGEDGVEVDAEVQRAAEALDRGDAAGPASFDSATRGAPTLEAEDGAQEDGEDRSGELVVPGAAPAEPEGEAQDPLSMPDVR